MAFFSYRDSGIRTHDLLNPIQVRYQLRYVPLEEEKLTPDPDTSREKGEAGIDADIEALASR